jgi:hypothetical protein
MRERYIQSVLDNPEALRQLAEAGLPLVDIPGTAWCNVHEVHHLRQHGFVHEPVVRTPEGNYRVRCRCSQPFEADTLGAAHDALFGHLREMKTGVSIADSRIEG